MWPVKNYQRGKRRPRLSLARLTFLLPLLLYIAIFYGYPLFYSIQISLEKYDLGAEITGIAPFSASRTTSPISTTLRFKKPL